MAANQNEKTPTSHHVPTSPREEVDSTDGPYIVKNDVVIQEGEDGRSPTSQLKTTSDGAIVLIPQPSDDPNDPLNWSSMKKHLVFLSLLPGCFLTDWVITWGSTLFEAQAADWKVSSYCIAAFCFSFEAYAIL
jgi:hypothetical protein